MSATFPLLAQLSKLPPAFAAAKARDALAQMRAEGASDPALAAFLADPRAEALLIAALGNSPYLARTVLREPAMLSRLMTREPGEALRAILADMAGAADAAADFAELQRVLRAGKRHAAVLIALCDIAGAWPLLRVTEALSAFADQAIGSALAFLLRAEAAAGRLVLADHEDPVRNSALIVLAMGKYGAHELNYSSDVDLIVFYDADRFPAAAGQDAQAVAIRVTRNLVRALSEQTGDGYVFRTDLRLRPDAGATQVALSTQAAELYYESMGQNWERAAMIKARPCAGDLAAGERLLQGLRPFIWRRHLDFAAIEDIHSIKRQIHAHRGHAEIAVAGHNIKLGRGGIREIEFFVQTQQLILGGRDPSLRGRTTCGMLEALAERGHVARSVAAELAAAYVALRHVEHRLQMIDDAQTHSLPPAGPDLDHVARFCGYAVTADFEASLRATLETVQRHYAALFESAPPLSEARGSLVFTGVEDDPETLDTLSRMGFKRAGEISAHVRSWHHGRLRATRSARGRELLTKLVPLLLTALARTGDPDTAFFRFHTFLEGLPAGVQLFSLFLANPNLLDMLAQSLGTAPRLASYLARHTAVIDALLDAEFAERLPETAELAAALGRVIGEGRDYQDTLDAARRFAHEQNFRVGFQILNGAADAVSAGLGFTRVAETVVRGLFQPTIENFAERHGHMPGAALAVLALGKFGGREMSAASDLDLIFIYDAPEDARSQDPRPLSVSEYYARLAQRLINALTAPTAEGKLYDVDMRLRPSGSAGPVATRFASFERYQREEAWTWEHMALTRARVVAGDGALAGRTEAAIRAVLQRPRERAGLARDVVDMRQRLAKEFPSLDPWELKHVRGGLIDLEFIAQYFVLLEASRMPSVISANTRGAIQSLAAAGALPPSAAQALERAWRIEHTVLQVLRMAVEGPFRPADAAPGLADLLCRATGEPSLTVLERALIDAERDTHALFGALIEQAV